MEEIVKIYLSDIQVDKNDVLRMLDCRSDSPVYDEVMEEYKVVESIFCEMVRPQTRLLFDEIPPELAGEELPAGTKVVYLIHTVGAAVSDYCTKAFSEDDYLKGMIMNAMSSSFLFKMDLMIQDVLKAECRRRCVGIERRLEAPRDIPMLAQKIACDKLFPSEEADVTTTSAYMLDPPKSDCEIFLITEDKEQLHTAQDCSACAAENCVMRKKLQVDLKIISGSGTRIVPCRTDESILDTLRRHRMYPGAACGGTGRCGKCGVQFLDMPTEPAYADRVHYTQEDLDKGMRLACQAFPQKDCTIHIDFADETRFEILTDTSFSVISDPDSRSSSPALDEESYAIAMDIGTTTIAAALVGLTGRRPIAYYTTLNRQRMFGADVISRIQASSDGRKDQLQTLIREDILLCVTRLAEDNRIDKSKIKRMVLAGNTTMCHLLRGYPCQTLGVFPFTPFSIKEEEMTFSEVLDSGYLDCPVTLFPGISTYVGGDIVSGLLSCGFASEVKTNLFIDLGTNGEMAAGSRDKILATSTAAGPAFEGGNILWGTGSIKGAISSVVIDGEEVRTTTIAGAAPTGICGTGIIEVMAELLKAGIIDETGLLEDRYFKTGFPVSKTAEGEPIVVTQRDIREIQLAKSAVRAGIEVLLLRYGLAYSDISAVWLAGGFGVRIDQEKAIAIGMLPEEFRGRIYAVGNSSLSGAIRYSIDRDEAPAIGQILETSTEINLSNDKDFNSLYVDYMYFQ